MFRKILIANRGEIALRVIYACKELNIPTVAVYSDVDRNSLHVRYADEAVCIGPARSSESYLNIPAIISAAEITNVDGIHPGYGYLAESAHFAEVCGMCGIKFIGPSPESINLMGDKALARETMKEAGLPIIPGSGVIKPDTDEKTCLSTAKSIGYPLLIKAVAGGGGKGMRIVKAKEELIEAIMAAQAEARGAFNNADVYFERYLQNPRHIEFQILADEHGNVIHLGERECSIQRRHQKLVEESPSPVMTAELRSELGQRIVQAVARVNYQNAGTMEFLFDEDGGYFFIEMNTRVQVEHGVTEMVTGLDVVKQQIRIAAGDKLPIGQDQVKITGHAVECRINAESPITFKPSPGTITAYHAPGGPGIRVDSCAHPDCAVSPYYDSLIAKLIAHGSDRREALARLNRALETFTIEGIETTIAVHKKIINHPDFIRGDFSTSFIDKLPVF